MPISISIQNDSGEDGYFWVWDIMKFGAPMILSGERINSHSQRRLSIDSDGNYNGKISWRAQNCNSGTSISADSIDVSSNDIVSIDVPYFVGPALRPADYSINSIIDPETVEIVRELYMKSAIPKDPNQFEFGGVEEVKIIAGSAAIDYSQLLFLPSRIEEYILTYVNCINESRQYIKREDIITRDVVSIDITKTTTSSSTLSFKLGLTGALSVGGDLSQKLEFSFSEKSSQQQSVERHITRDINVTIRPMSIWTYKMIVEKGMVSAPLNGVLCIDALIKVIVHDRFVGTMIGHIWLSDHRMLPNDRDRIVDFQGRVSAETYSKDRIIETYESISADDDRCRIAHLFGDDGWISSG